MLILIFSHIQQTFLTIGESEKVFEINSSISSGSIAFVRCSLTVFSHESRLKNIKCTYNRFYVPFSKAFFSGRIWYSLAVLWEFMSVRTLTSYYQKRVKLCRCKIKIACDGFSELSLSVSQKYWILLIFFQIISSTTFKSCSNIFTNA